jgi:hypothetical protein
VADFKKVLGTIGKTVAGVVTGGASDRVLDIIEGAVSPEAKAEVQKARLDKDLEIRRLDSQRDQVVATEAAKVIIAEAQSDSVLAKTARPGSIWAITLLIFANYSLAMVVNQYLLIWQVQNAIIDPVTRAMTLPAAPTAIPVELPWELFGVWATCLGGYIWSRRLEKRDTLRANEGVLE